MSSFKSDLRCSGKNFKKMSDEMKKFHKQPALYDQLVESNFLNFLSAANFPFQVLSPER